MCFGSCFYCYLSLALLLFYYLIYWVVHSYLVFIVLPGIWELLFGFQVLGKCLWTLNICLVFELHLFFFCIFSVSPDLPVSLCPHLVICLWSCLLLSPFSSCFHSGVLLWLSWLSAPLLCLICNHPFYTLVLPVFMVMESAELCVSSLLFEFRSLGYLGPLQCNQKHWCEKIFASFPISSFVFAYLSDLLSRWRTLMCLWNRPKMQTREKWTGV